MKRPTNSRTSAPISVLVAGTIVAGAVAIGYTWGAALVTEVITVLVSAVYFVVTGRDSDVGAIYGQRADERQRLVRSSAAYLALVAMMIAAFLCAVVSVALKDNYWQADVIASVGGVAYLFGIQRYGAHDDRSTVEYRGIMATGRLIDDEDSNDDEGQEPSRNDDGAKGEQ